MKFFSYLKCIFFHKTHQVVIPVNVENNFHTTYITMCVKCDGLENIQYWCLHSPFSYEDENGKEVEMCSICFKCLKNCE